jgi:hypothetical protein
MLVWFSILIVYNNERMNSNDDEDDDDLHYIVPSQELNSIRNAAVVSGLQGGVGSQLPNVNEASKEKSLGVWFFDKKQRKRRYVALTGKVYTGGEAVRKARLDQQSENHPSKTARFELKYLTTAMSADSIMAILKSESISAQHHSIVSNVGGNKTVLKFPGASPTGTASATSDSALLHLSSWGFPQAVLDRYAKMKVTRLFPWQIDCLTCCEGAVLAGQKNLIYSAPTSGGKTLVAEVLILRHLARFIDSHSGSSIGTAAATTTAKPTGATTGAAASAAAVSAAAVSAAAVSAAAVSAAAVSAGAGTGSVSRVANSQQPLLGAASVPAPSLSRTNKRHTIFFVVPFVALAEEKANYFQEMWQDINVGVKAFHGDGGSTHGNVLSEDVELAVCTIERANILVTQLLDEKREDQLKMVVIDEIHMLADAHRGYLLEVLLSKIRFLLRDQVQVIGMSATLPNIQDLSGWLDAALYTTEYRPVDLEVKVCVDRKLYTAATVAAAADAAEPAAAASVGASVSAPLGAAEAPSSASARLAPAAGPCGAPVAPGAVELSCAGTGTGAGAAGTGTGTTAEAETEAEAASGKTGGTQPSDAAQATAQQYPQQVAAQGQVQVQVQVQVEYTLDSPVAPLVDDPDGMKRLCLDTVLTGKSVMLFCSSKRRCEVCAIAVAATIKANSLSGGVSTGYSRPPPSAMALLQPKHTSAPHTVPVSIPELAPAPAPVPVPVPVSATVRSGRVLLLENLALSQVGLCPVLRQSIPQGVAYHHAGLTQDERRLVEDAYRAGVLQVLCTTSTLSAGVNLPAHRVIIR